MGSVYTYDALNRLILVSDGCGARAAYHYDSQEIRRKKPFKISDEVDRVIHYHYDAVGNLTEKKGGDRRAVFKARWTETKSMGRKTCYRYDKNGNCVESISPKGYRRTWEYDALDQVVGEEEQDAENGIHRKFGYSYDQDGTIVCRMDRSLPKRNQPKLYL